MTLSFDCRPYCQYNSSSCTRTAVTSRQPSVCWLGSSHVAQLYSVAWRDRGDVSRRNVARRNSSSTPGGIRLDNDPGVCVLTALGILWVTFRKFLLSGREQPLIVFFQATNGRGWHQRTGWGTARGATSATATATTVATAPASVQRWNLVRVEPERSRAWCRG